MKKYWFLIPCVLLVFSACRSEHGHSHGEKHEGHHEKHKHKGANHHMHQSSVEDLIEKFESPERDDYQKPDFVMEYLGDLKGLRVMEIGSGSGYFTARLAQAGATVIAGDVDDEFLSYLKNKLSENGLDSLPIELKKLPYDSPKLKSESVDKVFLVNTYHHIENRSSYFAEVRDGLKLDGELIIVDFFKKEAPFGPPKEHKISINQVIEELQAAGFTAFEKEMDLLPYQYIVKAK